MLLNVKHKLKILSSLLNVDEMPSLIRAKAELELAGLLQGPEQRQRRQSLRYSARTVLVQEHLHAALDIDLAERLEDLALLGEGDILPLLQEYNDLDYPNGMQTWLRRLLDIATTVPDYNVQDRIEQDLQAMAVKTGTVCLAKVEQVTRIARQHQKTGNEDLIKTTLQKIYRDSSGFDVPFTLGHIGFLLADIFIRYRDAGQASQWAHACNEHWKACPVATQSMGGLQVLRSEILTFEETGSADYRHVLNVCDRLVELDISKGLYEEAAMKLDIILAIFYTCKAIPLKDRIDQIDTYLARIEAALDSVTGGDTGLKKAGLLQQKATFYMTLGSGKTDCTMEQNALTTFGEALSIVLAISDYKVTYQSIIIRQQIGLAHHECFEKTRKTDLEGSRLFLMAAQDDFEQSLKDYEAMSSTFQIVESKYWIALLKYEAYTLRWDSPDRVLDALLQAEAGYDDRRNEISVSIGFNAIRDKQALAKEKHVRDVYRFAIQVCVREGASAAAWQWVQKAKARSLSDMLGLGCLVPQSLLTPVLSDSAMQKLYERERALRQSLQMAASDQAFSIGLELRQLQEHMQAFPELRVLLDLRRGKSVGPDELITRWNALPIGNCYSSAVFIDWYVLGDKDIYVMMLQGGQEPFLRKLAISVTDVRSWINTYLVAGEMQAHSLHRSDDHPSQALRQLDGLVEVISEYVDSDVLLILSLAAPLDALPLHALHVQSGGDKGSQRSVPLIERNPLVYCSNLTVFLQCCESATAKTPFPEMKSTYMAVYEGTPTEPCDMTEQHAVYTALNELASAQHTIATTGTAVTREKIFADWPKSDTILFHGHCDSSTQDITEQSLILKSNSPNPQTSTYVALTVIDLFTLPLHNPLVSLLACGSSRQRLEPGDEPLGLVTALLCAGAASVVGTLWPVASGTVRVFATTFAEEMEASARASGVQGSVGSGFVDMAIVIQKTVRRLRRGARTRTPWHWAGFVLHGSMIRRGKGSVEWLRS